MFIPSKNTLLKYLSRTSLLACVIMFTTANAVENPRIIKDINTISTKSSALYDRPVTIDDVAYFSGWGGLWETDGTKQGTQPIIGASGQLRFLGSRNHRTIASNNYLYTYDHTSSQRKYIYVADLNGPASQILRDDQGNIINVDPYSIFSNKRLHFDVNGELLFFSSNHTTLLWKTDGVTATRVKTFNHRFEALDGVEMNGNLYFITNGFQLWKSDGTEAGTVLIKSLPGHSPHRDARYANFTNVNGTLFFSLLNANNDYDLWKSDGTASGTVRVKENIAGCSYCDLFNFTVFGDEVYFFSTYYENSTRENALNIWKSDGTAAGTQRIKSLPVPGFPSLRNLTSYDVASYKGQLFFSTHTALWKTDGTEAGTVLIRQGLQEPRELVVHQGLLYFSLDDGTGLGHELWKTDGSSLGTSMVKDIAWRAKSSSPHYLTSTRAGLIFQASSGKNLDIKKIWVSDGTASGTKILKDINPQTHSSAPKALTNVGDKVYFLANTSESITNRWQQWSIWRTDGSEAGTRLVANVNENVISGEDEYGDLISFNNSLYFVGNDGSGWNLWKADDLVSDAHALINLLPGAAVEKITNLTVFNNSLYFIANNGVGSGVNLWKLSPNATEAVLVTSGFIAPDNLSEINGELVFFNHDELWHSDGTSAGTNKVKSLELSGNVKTSHLQPINNSTFMFIATGAGYPGGSALYISNGTEQGTFQASTPVNSSQFLKFIVANDVVMYTNSASNAIYPGRELWVSNGTSIGTKRVNDTEQPVRQFIHVNGVIYIDHGSLWKSDGTVDGTILLEDIYYINGMVNINDQLHFSAQAHRNSIGVGSSLYRSNGEISGSVKIAAGVKYIREVGGHRILKNNIFIGYATNQYGQERWGAWKIDKNNPEIIVSAAADIVLGSPNILVDRKLFFSGGSPKYGAELFVYDLPNQPARLGDLIWHDLNADGVQDANEPGLPGISIELQTCSGQTLESTTSGTDGSFAFANLSPDNYQMQFTLPANHLFSPEKAAGNYQLDSNANTNTGLTQCYSMADGQERLSIDVGMIPAAPVGTGVLGDYVWSDLNGDGKQDSNEVGLANVSIDLRNCSGGYLDTLSTDTSGGFRFDNLVPGDYQMQFHLPASHQFSPEKAAGNYQIDSNVNPATGLTQCYSLDDNQERLAIDAGMVPKTVSVSDTVTISQAIYFTADNRLWIRATSDASPAGSANITATMVVNGIEVNLGQVSWKADKGLYQHVFKNLIARPGEITLSSDLGGSASGYVRIK